VSAPLDFVKRFAAELSRSIRSTRHAASRSIEKDYAAPQT